jgi:putative oxidoreductase
MKTLVTNWNSFVDSAKGAWLRDGGLLFARVAFAGGMIYLHGWGKLTNFANIAPQFPDPLGIGSANSLALATFAEFFAAAAILFGFATRLAVLPLIPTMIIAAQVANSGKAGAGELALLYLAGFVTILLTGPGRFSLDHLIGRKLAGAPAGERRSAPSGLTAAAR